MTDNRGPVYHGGTIHYSHETAPKATGKHTPGPWRVGREFGTDAYVWAHPNDRGCIATVNLYGKNEDAVAVRRANLTLIAAAPAMLDALKQAESFIQAHGSLLASANILKVARAAIAQAEG